MRKSNIIRDLQDMLAKALPEVKYIDKDWGQLYMEHPPVGWPCILIDIEEMGFRDLSDLNEQATATVVLTVADKRVNSSSANAPRKSKEKSMGTIDLTDDIHLLVQGFSAQGATYTPFRVASFLKVNEVPGAEVYAMRYTTRYNIMLSEKSEKTQRHGEDILD